MNRPAAQQRLRSITGAAMTSYAPGAHSIGQVMQQVGAK